MENQHLFPKLTSSAPSKSPEIRIIPPTIHSQEDSTITIPMAISQEVVTDSTSGLKRKILVAESNSVDNTIIPPDITSINPSITWVNVHKKLNDLEQFLIPTPDLELIFTMIPGNFLPDNFNSILSRRPSSIIPLSIARLQYHEWIKPMSPDAVLTSHQINTVAQYVNLLYMETFQVLKDFYSRDLQVFIEIITKQHPNFDLDTHASPLQIYYHTIDTNTWGDLTSNTSNILSFLESDIALDTLAYTDSLLNFAHGIEVDHFFFFIKKIIINQLMETMKR